MQSEETAEFEHQPRKAKRAYRIVVLRRRIHEERHQRNLGVNVHYFFFVTNEWDMVQNKVVAEAHERCDQKKIIQQLKGGIRALHAPLNNLEGNWAYMVFASLGPIEHRWR